MNAPESLAVKPPRLTSLSHGGGCGCKIAPGVLSEILKGTKSMAIPPQLLVGIETADDAAVYQLNDEQALIATTDFFMPIVDDPYDFGRIAATNAISDVYAMGGTPIMALALVGMPINVLPLETIALILKGGESICAEAGIPIAGGPADRLAAFEHAPDGAGREHVDRHAHQRQRHDRSASHGVDVADRVGGGNAAEVVRVVDDGHEEVGRRDQRLLVIELVHRGVVGGLDAHEQFLGHGEAGRTLQDFAQHTRGDLAAAAAAVREGCEAYRFLVGSVHRGFSSAV